MTRKERKNERKKRLKSLILLLFLTIILLSTSTYAWFTSNRTVTIDPINVNVAAASGLQISTDATEWKALINNNDITTPQNWSANVNQFPSELAPVSTVGDTNGQFLKFFKGVVEGDANNGGAMSLTATATPEETKGTNGDFIAFDIFLKVDDAATVYLDNGSGVTVTSGQDDKGLQFAARYAFVVQGTVASTNNSASDTANAIALPSSNPVDVIIVEPNYDGHKASGTNNASTYYNQTASTADSGVAAIPYYGVKAPVTDPVVLVNTNPGGTADSNLFTSVNKLYKTNVAYSTASATGKKSFQNNTTEITKKLPIFDLTEGITKIRVYMWIEGQDVDCENKASGAYLTYKLGFTLDDDE